MAAGPKRLIKDYIETLENQKESIKELNIGLEYAPGWSVMHDMDSWFDIKESIERIDKEIREALQILNYELPQYEDKTYEEMVDEKYGSSE
jgi:hypothetical protein